MKEYNVGEIVDFKVKSVFQSYCELQDEQTVTYLQNTDNMRLSKGQTLRCKILSASGLHPRVMLLDYGDIDHKENKVDERVLTEILGEMGSLGQPVKTISNDIKLGLIKIGIELSAK